VVIRWKRKCKNNVGGGRSARGNKNMRSAKLPNAVSNQPYGRFFPLASEGQRLFHQVNLQDDLASKRRQDYTPLRDASAVKTDIRRPRRSVGLCTMLQQPVNAREPRKGAFSSRNSISNALGTISGCTAVCLFDDVSVSFDNSVSFATNCLYHSLSAPMILLNCSTARLGPWHSISVLAFLAPVIPHSLSGQQSSRLCYLYVGSDPN